MNISKLVPIGMEQSEQESKKRKWDWFDLGQVKQATYKLQLILEYTKFNYINYQMT